MIERTTRLVCDMCGAKSPEMVGLLNARQEFRAKHPGWHFWQREMDLCPECWDVHSRWSRAEMIEMLKKFRSKLGGRCQARRRNNEDCPHPALPSSDYCRVHSGARVELRGEAGPELYRP